MFGTQYYDRRDGPKNYKPINQWPTEVDPDDDIDYGFTKLPVRERRKLFMNDTEPPKIYQYGTLPRIQPNRGGSRFETHSEAGDWGPPIQRSLVPKMQTMPRRASTYGGQTISHKTLELRNAQFSRPPNEPQQQPSLHSYQPTDAITQDYIQPSYAAPRQSRPISRSQVVSSPSVGDQQRDQVSAGTRVIPARHLSYSGPPRQRDTMSVGPDTMSSPQNSQYGRPLRVRVYNSDRSALSPTYSQQLSNWEPPSPVYPAYPAYGPRPTDRQAQIYRVIQSPTKVYPRSLEQSYVAQPVYIALSPRGRRPNPDSQFQQKSLTIYPSRTNTTQTRSYNEPVNDRTQPMRVAPVQNAAPMTPIVPQRNPRIQQSFNSPVARVPPRERQIFNRRAPQPDEDQGVSEF